MERTLGCGLLTTGHEGQTVALAGWMQRRRDHGGLIFVDLRDRTGIVQLVFHPEQADNFAIAEGLSREDVLWVKGNVVHRGEDNINENLPTGHVEVQVDTIDVLNNAETPPFLVEDDSNADEAVRLEYRYVDLRRPRMQHGLKLRHKVFLDIRNFFDENGFWEIETPTFTKSTPEGARDYLVPSRTFPGTFFALPQSPQLFKQILMCSGVEKYFQIARCYRDEDLRADRQPEFTQLDLEISFMTDPEPMWTMLEAMLKSLFKKHLDVGIDTPFVRLPYAESMDRFGSDKPDMRFGMELQTLTDVVANSEFRVFSGTAKDGGVIKGIHAPGCGTYNRNTLDGLEDLAKERGAGGLMWIRLTEEGPQSPVAKFIEEDILNQIIETLGGKQGDLLLLCAGPASIVNEALGTLRLEVAKRESVIEPGWKFAWVYDFPMFQVDEDTGRMVSEHHPFTSPKAGDIHLLETEPLKARANGYDLALNGNELGSGSIRIHRPEVQAKIFELLGITDEEADIKFGFFLKALKYGAPPHGGIALGLDRLIMLMAGHTSLRDVIAFPKTNTAFCPLTEAPIPATPQQLADLYLNPMEIPSAASG